MTWQAFKVKKIAQWFNCPELDVWICPDRTIDELFELIMEVDEND